MVGLDEITAIGSEDRTGWSGAARSARLLELLALQRAVAAEVLRCAGEWDAALAWAEDGALTAASWLSRRGSMTTQDAREVVRSARLVQGNQATAKALATGDVTPAHVSIAARAACHVEDLYGEHEDTILHAARITQPEEFRQVMAHWRSLAENIVGSEPAAVRHTRRHLHVSHVMEMTRIDGWIDVDTGARFAQVLDALEPPDPEDGPETPRTLGQRRADALAKLVAGDRAARPEIVLVVDVDTIQGRFPADLTTGRCELLGGDPVDPQTIVRMACDAAVTRVLTQGASTILDLGRSTPTVSPAQRKALAIRDHGCVEPGCTAPPSGATRTTSGTGSTAVPRISGTSSCVAAGTTSRPTTPTAAHPAGAELASISSRSRSRRRRSRPRGSRVPRRSSEPSACVRVRAVAAVTPRAGRVDHHRGLRPTEPAVVVHALPADPSVPSPHRRRLGL